jgi:hypothetical protein
VRAREIQKLQKDHTHTHTQEGESAEYKEQGRETTGNERKGKKKEKIGFRVKILTSVQIIKPMESVEKEKNKKIERERDRRASFRSLSLSLSSIHSYSKRI